MAKFIEINGEKFELINTKKPIDERHKDYLGRRDLFDFYDRPSEAKQVIWDEWQTWERETPCVYDMRVTSASHFMFTIGAYFVDVKTDEIIGYFVITRDHNRLYMFA